MVATVGGLLTDPDSLDWEIADHTSVSTKELSINIDKKLIKLTRTGNLTAEGVTLRCLYSKLKDLWTANTRLVAQPFPFVPITNEQYEMVDGWNFDSNVNPTTKITITGCTGTINGVTINTSTGNFLTSNVFVGAYVLGTGIVGNVLVSSIESANSIQVDTPHSANISTNLTFFGDVDYTYNLIRTAGWAVKANIATSVTQEEWAGVISLGRLGEEGLAKTLTVQANAVGNTTVVVSDATGVVIGSHINAPTVPYGTTVANVNTVTNTIVLSKAAANLRVNSIINIRPSDRPYYQIGANSSVRAVQAIQPGQVNQPIKIYGDVTRGNIDLRTSNVAAFFSREQGYTYDKTTTEDIGISELTYQCYRFGLTTSTDALKITHQDSTISSNGITPTGSPYNNMSITWYDAPVQRQIGGTMYNFNVIIDANVALSDSTTYGTATAEQIYEYVQWALRRPFGVDIDAGSGVRTGKTTRELLEFVGDTLYTIYDSSDGGVYIDNFAKEDINRIVFSDNTNRTFPYVSFGRITFNEFLTDDDDQAVYQLYYKQINQGAGSLKFGERYAVIVKGFSSDPSGDGTYEIRGNLDNALSTVTYDYDWDENIQCSWLDNIDYKEGDEYRLKINGVTNWYKVTTDYTSGNTWASIVDGINSTEITGPTVVAAAIGRTNGQYTSSEGTIAKSNNNLITIVSARERNYAV